MAVSGLCEREEQRDQKMSKLVLTDDEIWLWEKTALEVVSTYCGTCEVTLAARLGAEAADALVMERRARVPPTPPAEETLRAASPITADVVDQALTAVWAEPQQELLRESLRLGDPQTYRHVCEAIAAELNALTRGAQA